ncbi:argininosuccinate lyase [Acidiferrobacter sp.]|uniref:argininosuccinate lyase n=1 Tax=Acidiferrobacter sp. TaxID=1872107 RepID=UPI002630396A|nr:argininosuccinate lyase [Acidiferrobacter sp.]
MPPSDKAWKGRFTEPTDAFVEAFTASVGFDQRLYRHDIRGSVAHARMLAAVGIITEREAALIAEGLAAIEKEIDEGRFTWSVGREDVHMNIEAALIERIGEVGKKLHTARSRNDQVATTVRLYLRDGLDGLIGQLQDLGSVLLALAERENETVMPGFTHLQVAQPVTLGHHILAWFEMTLRDAERLIDARGRVNVMPLGAGALAGTSFPIDRQMTAQALGFARPAENSLDAVSDRDFVIECAAAAALIMVHLSRIAEELVLWSTPQFGFIELADGFCTGSSIMPQKKNPDVPELLRGKSARVIGHLTALLVLMKGQPLAYNKDNQEDKEPLFDTLDTVRDSLRALTELLPATRFQRERMRREALRGYPTATDLADYLVRRGLAFRDAHEAAGRAVRLAIDRGVDLADLPLAALKTCSPLVEADIFPVLTLEGSLAARDHLGGTAPAQVRAAVTRARARLAALTGGPARKG